ncbi:MAG: lipocalin family protein [Myxococcota bacterium]
MPQRQNARAFALRNELPSLARGARIGVALVVLLVIGGIGCASGGVGVGPNASKPLKMVESVDLERFAGLWYVISSMPTSAEEGAHNSTEEYTLREDGEIDIENRFRVGAFDGPEKIITMRGWVHNEVTNSEWRVQPIWPIRLSYLILELDPDYQHVVVGHPSKRYVWIMSRQPTLDPEIEADLRARLGEAGYDVEKIQVMPQQAR